MDFDSAAAGIPPRSALEVQYAAVPILSQDELDYRFGGGSASIDYIANGSAVHEPFAFVTTQEDDGRLTRRCLG